MFVATCGRPPLRIYCSGLPGDRRRKPEIIVLLWSSCKRPGPIIPCWHETLNEKHRDASIHYYYIYRCDDDTLIFGVFEVRDKLLHSEIISFAKSMLRSDDTF